VQERGLENLPIKIQGKGDKKAVESKESMWLKEKNMPLNIIFKAGFMCKQHDKAISLRAYECAYKTQKSRYEKTTLGIGSYFYTNLYKSSERE
jgi:hypothetical protein